MIKVCFVSLAAYPLFNSKVKAPFGGSEVQLYQIAKQLAQKINYRVSFLVGDYHQPTHENKNNIRLIKAFNLILTKPKYIVGILYQTLLLSRLHQSHSDIFIQRAAGIETGIIAFYCKLFKKKFIYMTASSIDCNGKYRKMKPLEGFLYEWGLKHTNQIVCQTQKQKQHLKNHFGLESVIIKNSFSIPRPTSAIKKYVLWVSSSQALKQPHIFLDLAQKFFQYRFVMIMPQNNPILWHEIFTKAQLIKNLQLIERVPFFKINSYFAKAKVFINTSTFEGFPNTFVQATMSGTPIISQNINPDNFLDKYQCGFCANGDQNKLYQLTAKLLTDTKLWSKMSYNAYSYVKKNHDINTNIKKLERLFR